MNPKSSTRLRPGTAWKRRRGWLVREERFADFQQAMQWVRRVAREAERWNHHPEIHVRWNTVTLRLRTEEEGGLTPRDWHWVDVTEDRLRRRPAGTRRPKPSAPVTHD